MNYKKTIKLLSVFLIVFLTIYIIICEKKLIMYDNQKNSKLIVNQHNTKVQNRKAKIESIEKELNLIEKNINRKINTLLFNDDVKKKHKEIESRLKYCKDFYLSILKNSFLYKNKYFTNIISPVSLEKIIKKEYNNYYEKEIQELEDQKEQIKKKYNELPKNLYKIEIDQIKFDQMYNYIISDNENNLPILKDFTIEEKKIIINNRKIHQEGLKALEEYYAKKISEEQKKIDKLNNQILKINSQINLPHNDIITKQNFNESNQENNISNLDIESNSLNKELKKIKDQKDFFIAENKSLIIYFKKLQKLNLLYKYEIVPNKEKIKV